MLKAVYLDDKEYAYLINFINEYRDENNRPNSSSAVRFLMQKGYEALYGKKSVNIPYNKSKINKDEIKKEVINEVMSEFNTKILTDLTSAINKLSTMQVSTTPATNIPAKNIPIETRAEQTVTEPVPTKIPAKPAKKLPSNIATNSLLANLLNNANK